MQVRPLPASETAPNERSTTHHETLAHCYILCSGHRCNADQNLECIGAYTMTGFYVVVAVVLLFMVILDFTQTGKW